MNSKDLSLCINLKYFNITLGVANVPCLLFASYFVTCLGSKMDVTARSLQLQARAPPCTLISLINVGPTLTDFEKFHPPQKKIHPPRLLIP